MYDREILSLKIVRELVENGALTESELCSKIKASRATVRSILESYIESGVLCKKSSGYGIDDSVCVAVLRVRENDARIRTFSSTKGVFADIALPFSMSLTREANAVYACGVLEKYRKSLTVEYTKVICCFVYDAISCPLYILPEAFALAGRTDELIACAVNGFCAGSRLFISDISFICFDGKSITRACKTPVDICGFLGEILEYACPDGVVFEGEDRYDITSLCNAKGIECSVVNISNRLYLYEKEIIARAVVGLVK